MKQQQQRDETSALLDADAAGSRQKRSTTTLRQVIWTVLRFRSSAPRGSGLHLASTVLELCILALILLNVVFAISESSIAVDPSLEPVHRSAWYSVFLFTSTIIFSIEYTLRLWSCVEDERYCGGPITGRFVWMTQPLSVLDLVALVPFYLEISFQYLLVPSYNAALVLRSLRLLRIVAFLRLERSYSALQNVRTVFSQKREELLVVTYLTLVVVLTASTAMFLLEQRAQPEAFASISASAWWAVETITSLGYGDIVPVTPAGRTLSAVLAVCGVVLFTIPGAVLSSGFVEVMLAKQRDDDAHAFEQAEHEQETEQETDDRIEPGRFVDTETLRQSLRIEECGRNVDRLHIAMPTAAHQPTSAAAATRSNGTRVCLSPRVAIALKLQQLVRAVEALSDSQRQLHEQLDAQQTQLTRMAVALETLSNE